eukprot:SAG22_NODE_1969_length_3234_cov_2.212759_3_plen_129_part_00
MHRHMIKYSYWRKSAPVADWIHEPGFDPHTCYYGGHNVARYVAHSFAWLRGQEYRIMGGQGWPWMTENQIAPSQGYNDSNARHVPDWGSTGQGKGTGGYARADALVGELLELDKPALKQVLLGLVSKL